jgi:hypothetical protein
MSRSEELYGRKSRTLLLWNGVGEHCLFGSDFIKDAGAKVRLI